MQSNLGDIFWQADWLYRTWAGLQIKNGTKIFELKISVIKHRNDKKKRFREKSTLIRVVEGWAGLQNFPPLVRDCKPGAPLGSLLHFVLERGEERDWGMSCSSGLAVQPGCEIKFHYPADCSRLQTATLNIK